ncbi:MAG: type II toxin-antitoxin system prevent-host-death family antitoxin [Patescibacteria group bacterium]|nr:type II toxin-antitoxin system prevent-host-death family antitoxin [Patescibacteria group bacterium]
MNSLISTNDLIRVSATELKNKTAEVLNAVVFGNDTVLVERYGKTLAKIVPVKEEKKTSKTENLAKYFGSLPDFPDVKKTRKFSRKTPAL